LVDRAVKCQQRTGRQQLRRHQGCDRIPEPEQEQRACEQHEVARNLERPEPSRACAEAAAAVDGTAALRHGAHDQRLALVFNFTPAASVTVVDLVKRQPLGEIEIPGCMLIYPSGQRGFSTLCSSGTLLNIRLDAGGAVAGRNESKPFNQLDSDPLFTASAGLGGVRYFPSLHGRIQPIDMKSDDVQVLPDWPLVSAEEKAANWRPSGWQVIASDDKKLLCVLMQADAQEGTHKDPATEVWVFNPATKTRVRRMRLVRPGSSIALTHGAEQLMLVQAGTRLDVYDPQGGALVRSMSLPGLHTRMLMEPVH
jgi:methylamine dehydrogenase heavy chain